MQLDEDTIPDPLLHTRWQIQRTQPYSLSDTKLEELTREVREHNNFARRVPILEEQMKVANHRIADLENHERMKERN